MKTLKSIISCSIMLLSVSLVSQAQSNQVLLEGGGASIVTIGKDDGKIEGSPYLNENFVPAKVSLGKDLYYVRYNIFNDEFEVKSDQIRTFNKHADSLIITIVKDNTKFGSIDFIDNKKNTSRGYFMILTDNQNAKVKLYARKSISFIEAKPAKTGYDKSKPAEFKQGSDLYFISMDNNPAIEISKKKKDILKLFPDWSDKISDFIKSNKLKTTREEDLIKLVNYIGSL